jgi:hypothetical protein
MVYRLSGSMAGKSHAFLPAAQKNAALNLVERAAGSFNQ